MWGTRVRGVKSAIENLQSSMPGLTISRLVRLLHCLAPRKRPTFERIRGTNHAKKTVPCPGAGGVACPAGPGPDGRTGAQAAAAAIAGCPPGQWLARHPGARPRRPGVRHLRDL